MTTTPCVTCPHCKRGFRACYYCFESGHTKANCFKKNPSQSHSKPMENNSNQHSTHLNWYTKEEEAILELLQQKYPLLHLLIDSILSSGGVLNFSLLYLVTLFFTPLFC
ncbi:hypothetical protein VP01_6518g1 [Puccinia sorghi]|uniref:CCHC-type domain-containing protein n=1 Tax=Puccinia sorghi TaxID=27349 RepID=A0A0L6UHM9_9BASI|nr:hypothetical protein VP01_6518g1 [Puccinia sorghi]